MAVRVRALTGFRSFASNFALLGQPQCTPSALTLGPHRHNSIPTQSITVSATQSVPPDLPAFLFCPTPRVAFLGFVVWLASSLGFAGSGPMSTNPATARGGNRKPHNSHFLCLSARGGHWESCSFLGIIQQAFGSPQEIKKNCQR